jgi:hypothetical protein
MGLIEVKRVALKVKNEELKKYMPVSWNRRRTCTH